MYIMLKKRETVTDNLSIRRYVNEKENRTSFKIKTGYYFKLLSPETMKLLGITKSKITKDENGETVPHLENTEIVLIYCNIINNDYQQDSRVLYTFVANKLFGQLPDISTKKFMFFKRLTQNFYISKQGLLIKILNHLRYKIK